MGGNKLVEVYDSIMFNNETSFTMASFPYIANVNS